jgi:hypothetical protein
MVFSSVPALTLHCQFNNDIVCQSVVCPLLTRVILLCQLSFCLFCTRTVIFVDVSVRQIIWR